MNRHAEPTPESCVPQNFPKQEALWWRFGRCLSKAAQKTLSMSKYQEPGKRVEKLATAIGSHNGDLVWGVTTGSGQDKSFWLGTNHLCVGGHCEGGTDTRKVRNPFQGIRG